MQHYVPSPHGLIKNTYSINPGEIVTFNEKGEQYSKNYWKYPDYEEIQVSEKYAISELENQLISSVGSELVSDVPLGAFLSGGVDSPLICYYASL